VPLLTGSNQNNGKGSVPMARWAYIAFLFYSINMLNNWAFAFNISVPVHIILRSFGSVTTMLAGVVRGKRYSKLQVTSVVILTVGVLVSAWADSMSKVSPNFEVRYTFEALD
jgi:UDP-xylose/UDP-N-acetylglucosamine transporter B4